MLYSHTAELAIRAALFLALQPPGKLSPVREIARHTGLPRPYLAKILQELSAAGLVRAFRGPGGGLELGRAPEQINLLAIVCAVERPARSGRCVLGLETCSGEQPCALHHRWLPLREEIERLLQVTTLASLVQSATEAGPGRQASAHHQVRSKGPSGGVARPNPRRPAKERRARKEASCP